MASDPVGTVQGLASGIQWRDMIDQIMKAESAPIDALNKKISAAQSRESAWNAFKAKVQAFSDAAKGLADGSKLGGLGYSIRGLTGTGTTPFDVTMGTGAVPGNYQVAVSRLAAAEKLGGKSFASSSSAANASGEFFINGTRFQVDPTETLASIAAKINSANTGANPVGVSAGVVASTTGGYRLVLTSSKTGAAGISLLDGTGGALGTLGLLGASTSVKNPLSMGMQSDGFADATTAVGALLRLQSPPLTAIVNLGGVAVEVDLSADSLNDIVSKFNAAKGGSTATLATVTDPATGKVSLKLTGAPTYTDANGILESLGFVQGSRAGVAQQLQGAALLGGAATGATLLTDLGAQANETLTLTGTRADGSALTLDPITVAPGTTVNDVLAALNDSTRGLKAGTRTATAQIVNGRITVTDDVSGDSLLSLSVIANNELGGTLDFGAMTTTTVGQTREITAGADALVQVDGTPVRSASNTITDAIAGVTLSLKATNSSPATLGITPDNDASVAAIKALIKGYNDAADFVAQQMTAPTDGSAAPALYADMTLRGMRTNLNAALQQSLAPGVAGSWTRLGEIGITMGKDGKYAIDDAKLSAAVASDPTAVQRMFGIYGSSDTGAISFLTAGDRAKSGAYGVQITAASTTASATGGAFAAPAAGDQLTVTDLGSGGAYALTFTGGEDLATIAANLNTAFATATTRQLQLGSTLYSDSGATTAATDTTLLTSTYTGANTPMALAADDVLTVSGTRSDGASFAAGFTVQSTSTLADLKSFVQQQFGSGATVAWNNGKLAVTAAQSGLSLLSLAISSSGAQPNPLGAATAVTQGRPVANLTATVVTDGSGDHLRLTSGDYGSATGFTVTSTGGIGLGSAQGDSYRGTDVAGTIGGLAATGLGQVLTGATGTDVEGLSLKYAGAGTGSQGIFTFSRGIASLASLAAAPYLGADDGSINSVTDRIDTSVSSYNKRIDDIQARLDRRREQLIKQYTAMEQALAKSQSQMQWLTQQMNAMSGSSSSKS